MDTENKPGGRWRNRWYSAKSHALAAVAGAWLYASLERLVGIASQLISHF